MTNTVDRNARFRQTYNPVNVVGARRFDEPTSKGPIARNKGDQKCQIDAPCDTSEREKRGG